MSPDCIFCKIVRGELPSYKVYEDEKTLAFFDIRPVNAGHTLVVPKKHSQNIFDIQPEDWTAVADVVRKLSTAIEKGERRRREYRDEQPRARRASRPSSARAHHSALQG